MVTASSPNVRLLSLQILCNFGPEFKKVSIPFTYVCDRHNLPSPTLVGSRFPLIDLEFGALAVFSSAAVVFPSRGPVL